MPASPTDRRSVSAWDWLLALLMAGNLGWTTLHLGGFLPEARLISGVATLGTLALWLLGRALAPARPALAQPHPAGWWLLPFLLYALGNVFWVTPVRWLGWADWFGWAQLVAMFWLALNVLSLPGPRRLVHTALAATGVVAVALAAYQRFVDPDWLMLGRTQVPQFVGRASGPFGIPNSLAALLLLLLPPALAAALNREIGRGWRCTAAALAAVYLGGLGLTISRGAWISLGLTLALWPLLAPGRSWRWRLGVSGSLAVAALAVGAALYATVPDVRTRFDSLVADAGERTRPIMWRGAWRLFEESPVVGTGAGSYNVLFERHRPLGYRDEPKWAHNDYLNTLSDYGAAGFALFFGAVAAIAWIAWRAAWRSPAGGVRAVSPGFGCALGLLAFGLSLGLDFYLKIPALALALTVCAAEGVRRAWPASVTRTERGAWWRLGAAALGLAVAGLVAGRLVPLHRAEALRHEWRRQLDTLAETPPAPVDEEMLLHAARAAFARAAAIGPDNAQTWADASYAASLLARHRPTLQATLGREAEMAARKALAAAPVVSEFWWRLGVALDMQGRWTEAGAASARALELAPHSALAWYYHAYHLSLKPAMHPLARSALATCLRLDPGMRAAETLREKLEARQ